VDAEKATEALKEVHEQLGKMPDSPEKELVAQTLEQLETESQENKMDAGDVADVIEGVAEALPDVAEATLETVQELAKGPSKKSK
jgi:hypothetical protein